MTESVTGIPIEYLFAIIGALVVAVYTDLRSSVYRLSKGAVRRDRILTLICDKLKIPFNTGDD